MGLFDFFTPAPPPEAPEFEPLAAVAPEPAPSPEPDPAPVPELVLETVSDAQPPDIDRAMWDAVRAWATAPGVTGATIKAKNAIKVWSVLKGL